MKKILHRLSLPLAILVLVIITLEFTALGRKFISRTKNTILSSASNIEKVSSDVCLKNPAIISPNKNPEFNANPDGTIKYLFDNFSEYGDLSKVITYFDTPSKLNIHGAKEVYLDSEKYNGANSLRLTVTPDSTDNNTISVRQDFDKELDLSRWANSGYLSGWMKIEDRTGILGVRVKLGDNTGAFREFNDLTNLQLGVPNRADTDDPYIDLPYPESKDSSDEWNDFWLEKGWNYLPWAISPKTYKDVGSPDMKNISWIEVAISTNPNLKNQSILLNNFRIQDGLQKANSPSAGNWYPPSNRFQYGIYDINKANNGSTELKLLNVRQSQYPSNGDHGRIISKMLTPNNFDLRLQFELTDFDKNKDFSNTWFRVTYDFDPETDPGHDFFGTYFSMQWSKLGLITVIPLEKEVLQDNEPASNYVGDGVDNFLPKANTPYELRLEVRGQNTKAYLYEIFGTCLKPVRELQYTFKRPRYGQDKRYPLAIEVTGNIKAIIHQVEVTGYDQ